VGRTSTADSVQGEWRLWTTAPPPSIVPRPAGLASDTVAESHLLAFERLQQAVSAGDAPQGVVTNVLQEIVRLFAARSWTVGLSEEKKRAVVERFLNALEKMPEREDLLAENKTTRRLYDNLGVAARLSPLLPAELPAGFPELVALVERCADDVPAERLLPLAERLITEHAEALAGKPEAVPRVARIFWKAGDPRRSFDLYAGVAGQRPQCSLSLYILAFEPVLGISEADRQSYLEDFLANGKPADAPSGKAFKYERHDAYQQAVHALFEAGHYAECVKLIGRCHDDTTSHYPVDMSLNMLHCKGQCLVALGDRERAAAVFREYLDLTERSPKHARVRRLVAKELDETSAE